VPLLYVDMLGMKARYHRGGTRAAQSGYRLLAELVQQGLEALPDGHAVRGGVQSDAVCLQFASAVDAVLVGRKLFADTFRRSNRSNLLWVRGVIVQGEPEMPIETTKQLQETTPEVFVREFAPPLVRAIHAEQSGFHGQRLLIESKLASREKVDQALRQEIGNGHLSPTHRLRYSKYPPPTGRYRDVLWPVPEDLEDWPSLCRRMLDRLRWASDGGDLAFLHASATHLLFEEISSILHSLTKSGEAG
jgi:hypothetical protein